MKKKLPRSKDGRARLGTLAAFGLVPMLGLCQALPPVTPPPVPPPPLPASAPVGQGIITVGTPRGLLDELLGRPMSGWVIPSLHRAQLSYPDGTLIVLINDCVVSARPSYRAQGSPAEGFLLIHNKNRIFFDPAVVNNPPPEVFYMAPPVVPPLPMSIAPVPLEPPPPVHRPRLF